MAAPFPLPLSDSRKRTSVSGTRRRTALWSRRAYLVEAAERFQSVDLWKKALGRIHNENCLIKELHRITLIFFWFKLIIYYFINFPWHVFLKQRQQLQVSRQYKHKCIQLVSVSKYGMILQAGTEFSSLVAALIPDTCSRFRQYRHSILASGIISADTRYHRSSTSAL